MKQKGREMPKKTIKKTAVKKPVAKKTAKKTVAKRVARPVVVEQMPVAPCNCGGKCCCCRGHRFIKFCIKLILLCLVFFAGALTAPWFMRHGHDAMMRHVQFDENNCLVYDSVKCPKMLESLRNADVNNDGCVSREEFRAAVAPKHHHIKMHIDGEPVETPESVEM